MLRNLAITMAFVANFHVNLANKEKGDVFCGPPGQYSPSADRPRSEELNVEFSLMSGDLKLFEMTKMVATIGECARLCTQNTACVSFAINKDGICSPATVCDPSVSPDDVLYYEIARSF